MTDDEFQERLNEIVRSFSPKIVAKILMEQSGTQIQEMFKYIKTPILLVFMVLIADTLQYRLDVKDSEKQNKCKDKT